MASVNKVILIGNLGADPEVRYAPSGSAVANLRLATNERWTDRDGNPQERTEWHSVSVWGKTAENCGKYLQKGRSVYVEGRLQSREYTDKEGIVRRVWDVVASQVVFLADAGGQREGGDNRDAWAGARGGATEPKPGGGSGWSTGRDRGAERTAPLRGGAAAGGDEWPADDAGHGSIPF